MAPAPPVALCRIEHVTLHQDVLEPLDCFRVDRRRRLPHLQLAIALRACNEGLRADAGEELLDGFRNLLGLRRLCPFLRPVDRVGPALDDVRIRTDVFVGRHEGRVVGRTDGLADRGEHVALAAHFELRRVRVHENRILVLACEPRADARGDGDVIDELHVLERVDAVLPKRSLEEEIRRAARPQRQDLFALELLPVELVDLLAPDQHEAVGHGEPAEDGDLCRGIAVLNVDRRFRSDQGDVRAVGEQRRHRLVAALRGRHRHIKAGVFEIAVGDGHVGGRIEDRAHDLGVANLHRRLGLRECVERRGDEQQAELGETNLKSTAAVEHGNPRVLR